MPMHVNLHEACLRHLDVQKSKPQNMKWFVLFWRHQVIQTALYIWWMDFAKSPWVIHDMASFCVQNKQSDLNIITYWLNIREGKNSMDVRGVFGTQLTCFKYLSQVRNFVHKILSKFAHLSQREIMRQYLSQTSCLAYSASRITSQLQMMADKIICDIDGL